MLYLLGDSITVGSPGVPYCKFFINRKSYKNCGLGGDTIKGLLKRCTSMALKEDDIFVIEIGTNDILLKYLSGINEKWATTVKSIEKSGRALVKSDLEFKEKYLELLNRLGHKNVIVVNIPCIGEEIESETNKKVDIYNSIIKELCNINGVAYIDYNNWQKEEIRKEHGKKSAFISKHPSAMIIDVILTKSSSIADYLSKKRHLSTTIDGVHLNSKGASSLATMIQNELLIRQKHSQLTDSLGIN